MAGNRFAVRMAVLGPPVALVGIPFFLGEVPVSEPGNQAEDDQSEHGISSQ